MKLSSSTLLVVLAIVLVNLSSSPLQRSTSIPPILAASQPSDDWPMFRHDTKGTGYTASNGPTTNNVLWNFATEQATWFSPSAEYFSSPTIASGLVYYCTRNYLYCFNETTGLCKWKTYFESDGFSSPTIVSDKLYIGGSHLYCFNAVTGSLIWMEHGGDISSSPTVVFNRVYVGSLNNGVYCYNATSGNLLWSYMTAGRITSSPSVISNRVYLGSYDTYFYCLNATTGELLWRVYTDHISCSPAIVDGYVFVGSNGNGNMYSFNSATGDLEWVYNVGSMYGSPAVMDNRLYIGTYSNKLYCLDAPSGSPLWNKTLDSYIFSSPTLTTEYIYIGTFSGTFYCLSAETGEQIWYYSIGSQIRSSAAVANDRAYISTADGILYCFGEFSNTITLNLVTRDSYGEILPACQVTMEGVGSIISDSNGMLSFTTSRRDNYSITTRWQNSVVNQTTIATPISLTPIDIECSVYYRLKIDPTFYDAIGYVLNTYPSDWTIRFPNGTMEVVSTAVTYSRIPKGVYSIREMTWNGIVVYPYYTPKVNLSQTYDVIWSPSVNCHLPTNLSISLSGSTSIIGYKVEIEGDLTYDKKGLAKATILFSYSINNGQSWNDITQTRTTSDGSYLEVWMPSATGNYLVRAKWGGNVTFPGSTSTVSLAVTSSEKNVFSVESNSTVSQLSFNSASRLLSFSVSGPSNTAGYSRVTIAKSLISDVRDVKVLLDGKQVSYTTISRDDSWVLSFTYDHSTHEVTVNLGQIQVASALSFMSSPLVIGALVGSSVVLIVVSSTLLRRRRR